MKTKTEIKKWLKNVDAEIAYNQKLADAQTSNIAYQNYFDEVIRLSIIKGVLEAVLRK